MSDFDTAINAVRLAIATAEALLGAVDKAKQTLDSSTAQLKTVLAEIEKERGAMHEQLARDRKEAREDFDKKFDHGGDGGGGDASGETGGGTSGETGGGTSGET